MKHILAIFSICCSLLLSCNSKATHKSQTTDFHQNRWEKTNVLQHQVIIDDISKSYNFILKFSHVYDYQFSEVPLLISIQNPKGEIERIPISLQIKDKNKQDLGDCMVDYCDLNYTFKNNAPLEKGTYKISISHQFKGTYLPNIIAVGLEINQNN